MADVLSFLTGRKWTRGKRNALIGLDVYFMDGAPSDKLVNLQGVRSTSTQRLDAKSFAFDDNLAGVLSALVTSFVISYELVRIDTRYEIRILVLGIPIPEHIIHFDIEKVDFGFVRCSYIFGRNVHTYVLRAFFDETSAVANTFIKFRPWSEEYCIYSHGDWDVQERIRSPECSRTHEQ